MRLRTTSTRTKHQIKRQRTPNRKRSNPFFGHLPLDVRRVMYDYMELPPFKTAKICAGLYLSCRQSKEEMDRAASVRVRSHLLRFQQDITSNGLVTVRLPKELENGSVPVDTTMDIDITIRRTANDAREDEISFQSYIHDIRDGLYCVKLGRLRIHVIDGMNGDLEQEFRESTNYWDCRRVIGSCLLWYPNVLRLRRIQALMVTCRQETPTRANRSSGWRGANMRKLEDLPTVHALIGSGNRVV
jgi:hypothetical protein